MNSFEARAFVEETHELLNKAAAGTLTEEEEDRVIELEKEAVKMINDKKFLKEYRIIRDDGAGPSEDPKTIAFNSLNGIKDFEVQELSKFIEFEDGSIKKLTYNRYKAIGDDYEVQEKEADGKLMTTEAGNPVMRSTNDVVTS